MQLEHRRTQAMRLNRCCVRFRYATNGRRRGCESCRWQIRLGHVRNGRHCALPRGLKRHHLAMRVHDFPLERLHAGFLANTRMRDIILGRLLLSSGEKRGKDVACAGFAADGGRVLRHTCFQGPARRREGMGSGNGRGAPSISSRAIHDRPRDDSWPIVDRDARPASLLLRRRHNGGRRRNEPCGPFVGVCASG